MLSAPTMLLDLRVPQPGRESDYGVPDYIVAAADVLYRARNTLSDVESIDVAIFGLFKPYIRGNSDRVPCRLE